jgi:hypothetical protein
VKVVAAIALSVAVVVFGVQVGRWQHDCDLGRSCADGPSHYILSIGAVALVVAGVALFVGVVARLVLSRARHGRFAVAVPTAIGLMLAGAVGLLAATPVTEGWYDGCNSNVARMPAIASVQL